jgi:hypothetical protein
MKGRMNMTDGKNMRIQCTVWGVRKLTQLVLVIVLVSVVIVMINIINFFKHYGLGILLIILYKLIKEFHTYFLKLKGWEK